MNLMIKSLIITLLIVSSLGLGGYSIFKIHNLQKENEKLKKEVKDLKFENINMKQAIFLKDKMLRGYEKTNKELALKAKRKNSNVKTNKTYTKNTTRNAQDFIELKKEKKSSKKTTKKSKKKYEKYSKNMHLISDSEIKIDKYNKLYANAPIYGRYKTSNYHLNKIYRISCNQHEKKYNAVDECRAKTIDGDTIYSTELKMKDMRRYNANRYMIECKYSKDYGIMHDCMLKMKS